MLNEGSGSGGSSSSSASIVAVTSRLTPVGNVTTTSSSYADLTSLNYTQATAFQVLEVSISGSLRVTGSASAANIRVLYDGVDVGVFPIAVNAINEHQQYAFTFTITGAATAGVKICKLQWAKRSGAGTLAYDTDDCHILMVRN